MPAGIHRNCLDAYLYADDLAVNFSNSCHQSMISIYDNLNFTVFDWCNANYLTINPSKSEDLEFNINSNNSSVVKSIKFLGIHLESGLGWNTHIQNVMNKISKSLYMLRILKNNVSTDTLLAAYYGHLYSHLNYGILLWGNHSSVNKVLLMQKRAIRIIAGVGPREHCKPLFVKFRILTVYSMYILSCLLYVRRNINSFTTFAQVHNYNTRNNSNLYPEKVKFSLTQNNFVYNSVKIFNNLPLDLRNIPLLAFSRRIRTKLLGNPLYSLSEFADISW